MAKLQVASGRDSGAEYDLPTSKETVIGREGYCDIVLAKNTVSRRHSRIICRGEYFEIEDLGSVNGTFVNGHRLDGPHRIEDGDRINIYDVPLVFIADESHISEKQSSPEEATTEIDDSALIPTNVKVGDRQTEEVVIDPRLQSVLEISTKLSATLELEDLLPRILDVLFEMFGNSSQGFVFLIEANGQLQPRASRRIDEHSSESLTLLPADTKIAREVLEKNQLRLERNDSGHDAESVFDESGFTSLVCVPIIGPSSQKLGVIQLETAGNSDEFTQDDLQILASIATIAGQSIKNAQSHQDLVAFDRRRRQLSMARDVQQRMLPQHRPEANGYTFHDYYVAADEVGGDYFSYSAMTDDRVILCLGDVCGKGMAAALMMAELNSNVKHALENSRTLKAAMHLLNQQIYDRGESMITFLMCVLDPQKHKLTIVNAGHLPPLLRRRDSSEIELLAMEEGGLPFGIESSHVYHPVTIDLKSGDMVLVYTDGVNEASNPVNELYGLDRMKIVFQTAPHHPEKVVDRLVNSVNEFREGRRQSDDMCIVCFGRD